jgi:CheY-like chemotaxis protein
MPKLGGFETSRRIRGRERVTGGHVPIIALTAQAMKGDREKCLDAGMDGYVSKPLRVAELFEVIQEVMGAGRADSTSVREDDGPAAHAA